MISAVILSHNDEKSIGKTLSSVAWCDETIVVDDGSVDHTCRIARDAGARVLVRPLDNDFATQRNAGLSQAKGDWVLFVDSDEVVSAELADEIKKKVQEDCTGYMVRRTDWMWGRALKYGETANVRLLRLARRNAGHWHRPVHETWHVRGKIGELSQMLQHYPHPNVAQFIEHVGEYSTINAQYYYKIGKRTNGGEILVYPMAKFLINYVWHLGFLDGTAGMIIAITMSMHSFLTRSKLWLLSRDR